MSRRTTMLKMMALFFLALLTSGCEGQLLVAGNVFFMGITCLMLWSTINLKKND